MVILRSQNKITDFFKWFYPGYGPLNKLFSDSWPTDYKLSWCSTCCEWLIKVFEVHTGKKPLFSIILIIWRAVFWRDQYHTSPEPGNKLALPVRHKTRCCESWSLYCTLHRLKDQNNTFYNQCVISFVYSTATLRKVEPTALQSENAVSAHI